VHEAAGILLAKMAGDGAAHVERAVEMHRDDVVPVGPAHLVEDAVAQDAGVVDQDIDAAEGVARGLDDGVGVLRLGDRQRAGDRLAAALGDLVDHGLRRTGVRAGAIEARADVVDHDARAFARQQQRDRAADAAAGAGDDRNLVCNDARHCTPSFVMPGLVPGERPQPRGIHVLKGDAH